MSIKVKQLFIFPVKSLRGIPVTSAKLSRQGLRYDRYWMLVKANGQFVTQRQLPQMVLIYTQLTQESLVLQKSGMRDLVVPLDYWQDGLTPFTAKIWKDYCRVVDEGDKASRWLTSALGSETPLRLVRLLKNSQRPQSKPDLLGENTHTHFADAAPYLICNQASLESLNQTLVDNQFDPVTMEHFRPNPIIFLTSDLQDDIRLVMASHI